VKYPNEKIHFEGGGGGKPETGFGNEGVEGGWLAQEKVEGPYNHIKDKKTIPDDWTVNAIHNESRKGTLVGGKKRRIALRGRGEKGLNT